MAYFDDACPCGENEDIPHFEHGTPDSDEDRPDSHDWIPDCGEDVPAATDSEEMRDLTEDELDELVRMDEFFERATRCGMEDGELPFEGAGVWDGSALPWLGNDGIWDRVARPARALVWAEPHPSDLGEGWHIREHFLDPLVKLLKEVDDRCDADRMLREWTDWAPEDHLDEFRCDDDRNGTLGLGYEHVEPLAWLTDPRDGRFLGAEAFLAGLHRALDFLEVEHLPSIRADLEACVTELADYVRALGGDDPFPVLERHNETHFRHALGSLSGTHPRPDFLNYLRDETSTEKIRDWGALFCYGYLVLPAIGRLTQMSANLKRRWPVERQDSGMASVDDFLRALDSIEAEIRDIPDVVFVEMSLTRRRIAGDKHGTIDKMGRYILLLAPRSIHAHWKGLCFDIGGPEFPFVWSPKRSAVYESFPQDLVNELESVEFAVWYYLDSWRSPIPQHLLDEFPPNEDDPGQEGLAAWAYQVEMDRVFNVMRSVKTAWSLAPEAVIRECGDLSRLPTGPLLPAGEGDSFDLWWPAALLTLAIREVDVVLTASADAHIPWDSIFDDLPEGGDHNAHIDAFEPTTWTVSLSPPSLMVATRCALRAFRRVAEDSMKKSSTVFLAGTGNGQDGTPAEKPNGTAKRKRRKRGSDKPRELTLRQVEAMQLYGECKGNFTEMGRRMGLDRKTAKQHYEVAAKKIGQQAVKLKHETTTIAHDRRGQADISEIDDARREIDSADSRKYKRRG